MSYTRSYVTTILRAQSKGQVKGNVLELGENNFHRNMIERFVKASQPSFLTCGSAMELWTGAGAKSYFAHEDINEELPTQMYDIVSPSGWLENEIDIGKALKLADSKVKVSGFIFLDLPIGVSVSQHSYTPNFWIKWCKDNNYLVRYCVVSDDNSNFAVEIGMNTPYTWSQLKRTLHKFRETYQLRLSMYIQKAKEEEPEVLREEAI